MRPAVHRDRRDVPLVVEAAPAEHPVELVADVRLHGLEGGVEELHPADPVLLAPGEPGFARIAVHPHHQRLVRRGRGAVVAERELRREPDRGVVAAGGRDGGNPRFGERPPVPQQHARVLERRLHRPGKGVPLGLRQFGHQVGNDVVPAGEDDPPGGDRTPPVVAYVGDAGRAAVNGLHPDDGRGQPDPRPVLPAVQHSVVERRHHHVFHGGSRDGARDEPPHEQPRDRGVAVREVEVRIALVRAGLVLPAVLAARLVGERVPRCLRNFHA